MSSASPVVKPRVRFAPSPTGYMHIGNIRTAIFNWLFARHNGGTFILRVDDTDLKRHNEAAVQVIYDGLKWFDMDWDEGPNKEGAHAPYFQSQRGEIYKKFAKKLEDSGRAYWAKKQIGDKLPDWKIEKMKKAGKWDEDLAQAAQDPNPALYFKMHPGDPEDVVFMDAVWGRSMRPADVLNDYVIVRGDGSPTYNFASTVDDIEMQITHIIRGEDHLANTPKQIRLFEALGAPLPVFAHLPMIHNDKGEKISKRRDAVAVTLYEGVGILPEALFNFLALLGWSPGENRELMTKEEMISSFDLERVKQSPGQFALKRKSDPAPDFTDEQRIKWLLEALPGSKLEWMNGEYLRKLPISELYERVKPFIAKRGYDLSAHKPEYILEALKLEQERARNLSALADSVKLFFQAPQTLDPKAAEKVLKKDGGAGHLKNMREHLAGAADFSAHALEEGLKKFAEQHGLKFGDVSQPIRVALSGTTVSPPIHLTLALLGKEESLRRIDAALAQVG